MLELPRQPERVAFVFCVQGLQFQPRRPLLDFGSSLVSPGLRRQVSPRIFLAHGPLRYRDDAEISSRPAPPPDRLGDLAHVVRNLRNQDHIGPAGNPCAQGQPASPMAHYLRHHDTMMAVRGAVQPVNRLRRNSQCSVETERGIGHRHVVINRLGQRQHSQALLPAAAQAHQPIQPVLLVVLNDCLGHVPHSAFDFHPVRFVAAGSQDGSAHGQNPGQRLLFEADAPVLG